MDVIKDIVLGVVFAAFVYLVFGVYLSAMFNAEMPLQEKQDVVKTCVKFEDGTKFGRERYSSISKYRATTGQSYKDEPCR